MKMGGRGNDDGIACIGVYELLCILEDTDITGKLCQQGLINVEGGGELAFSRGIKCLLAYFSNTAESNESEAHHDILVSFCSMCRADLVSISSNAGPTCTIN